MTQQIAQAAPVPPDHHEFVDISAPFDDITGERALQAGLRPLKLKMYDWNEIQTALSAGAPSEEEAKSHCTAHYVEVYVEGGTVKVVLLHGGEERGAVVLSIEGDPTFNVWDEFSESDDPEVSESFEPVRTGIPRELPNHRAPS